MAYRALSDVLLGSAPAARAGELIPATFSDQTGGECPVDFERLVEIGAAEKVTEPAKSRSKASAAQ